MGRHAADALPQPRTPRLGRRRATLLASLIAIPLVIGVVVPGLAQAQVNQPTRTGSSSSETDNPCEYNVTVPGLETDITIGALLAEGIPAVERLAEQFPPLKYAEILILATRCAIYLNSPPPAEQPSPPLQPQPQQPPPGYRLPCLLPDESQGEINSDTGQCGPVQ
jgi:hypothetical protein